MMSVIMATAAGCSNASDVVEPALWRHVDAAENLVYGILTSPTSNISTSDVLLERLSDAVAHWDGREDPNGFSEDAGTAVFYNFREDAGSEDVAFDVFLASGRSDDSSTPGWFGSGPTRVYTCYRIEVSFEVGGLSDFHRSHDHGEDRLDCPPELASALGDGVQYREPWVFDG